MKYTIKITGPGLNFEQEVAEDVAKRTMLSVLTGEIPVNINTEKKPDTNSNYTKPDLVDDGYSKPDLSIREFLLKYEPKRNPDKITAIALFLKKKMNKKTFSKTDIIESFENAAEPVPKNLGRDIRWALKSGWIAAKTGEDDVYYITGTGQTAVEEKFPTEMVKNTRLRSSTSRKNSKRKK